MRFHEQSEDWENIVQRMPRQEGFFYISGEAFMDNYPEMPPAKARFSEPLRA